MGEGSEVGSVWTWCANAETKLVLTYKVGDRDRHMATEFLKNVSSRMANPVQFTSDDFHGYAKAVAASFGNDVDYGQIVRVYGTIEFSGRKYSLEAYKQPPRRNPENFRRWTQPMSRVFLCSKPNGQTVWESTVEVFQLHRHPKATHAYAWSHDIDDPDDPKRHGNVSHMGWVTPPLLAVRAALVQEYRAKAEA